jgi:hypothetical protein
LSDTVIGPDRVEDLEDFGDGEAAVWARWQAEDRVAAKEEERWQKRAREVIKRYRDERGNNDLRNVHRFNILWSNVQTLKPALYARTPKPDVQRRWLDQDDTGRLASILLERAISYSLDNSDFDLVMEAVVEDRLLPGRGVPRVLYVPSYGDEIEPRSSEEFEEADSNAATVAGSGDKPAPLREVVHEEARMNYVFWEDYRESPARTWREVYWVRYRAYMNREQLIDRFGKKKGGKVNLDFAAKASDRQTGDKQAPPDIFKKAIVDEFWDKTTGKVIWLAPGTPDVVLDEVDDPLNLPDFFPSPDPLLATTTNDKRIPVPDYIEYQDQARELDTLTGRIDTLTRALKLSGVYPGEQKQVLEQLISPDIENKLIPVLDWAAWNDKGGLTNFIQWMPLKEIAETLIQLYAARDKTKELLYEITGIGDIMRGATSPIETLGAQQLKANFSTRRVQPQQRAVARIARDSIRLIGAVIAEHFSPQTISMITGYPQLEPVPQLGPPPPQFLPAPMPAPAPPANDQTAPALPPEAAAQLQEGRVTRFGNGQRWTKQNGQPRMAS